MSETRHTSCTLFFAKGIISPLGESKFGKEGGQSDNFSPNYNSLIALDLSFFGNKRNAGRNDARVART